MIDDRAIAVAARDAVRHLDDERVLRANPLFDRDAERPHDALRAVVLRALEALRIVQVEHHEIVVRCDVRREPHKQVVDALSLSRRQFYRERQRALVRLADAIQHERERTPEAVVTPLPDARETAMAFIDMQRGCGEHEAVWREAVALAAHVDDPHFAISLHVVASEAARFLGDHGRAAERLRCAARLLADLPDGSRRLVPTLWVAVGEIALHGAQARFEEARAQFARAAVACADERTLHGPEATLFEILISHVVPIDAACGDWSSARALLSRAEALMTRSAEAELGRAVRLRLSGRIALQGEGDVLRARAEQRAALDTAQRARHLRQAGNAAANLGIALGEEDLGEAVRHIEFGLDVVRRFSDDECATLLAESLPILLRAGAMQQVRERLDDLRARRRLSPRSAPLLDLSEALVLMGADDARGALERANDARLRLSAQGQLPWACDALLLEVESWLALRQPVRARRLLRELREIAQVAGRVETRRRVEAFGTFLAP
ncbi:MAG TPA: hypothetical protein VMA36_17085 [Candidatus Limnocylindria bacterium]|nr:hypothetical protein [Candidatus Limnocylindria bacterium]